MKRSHLLLATVCLAGLGQTQNSFLPRVPLKEEQMYIEYTVNAAEATVVVAAESEIAIQQIQLRSPTDEPLLEMRSNGALGAATQGFVVETREEPLADILANYGPGPYRILARTEDGRTAIGGAWFSHALPAAPIIDYPLDRSRSVPADFVTRWQPDPSVEGWRVTVGQGEDDLLSVLLPPEVTSLPMPPGVLEPGRETFLEVAAIGVEGNRTLLEISFLLD